MSSSSPRPYLDFIHEALEQAQLNKNEELFQLAVQDAMVLAALERLFNSASVDHPLDA